MASQSTKCDQFGVFPASWHRTESQAQIARPGLPLDRERLVKQKAVENNRRYRQRLKQNPELYRRYMEKQAQYKYKWRIKQKYSKPL